MSWGRSTVTTQQRGVEARAPCHHTCLANRTLKGYLVYSLTPPPRLFFIFEVDYHRYYLESPSMPRPGVPKPKSTFTTLPGESCRTINCMIFTGPSPQPRHTLTLGHPHTGHPWWKTAPQSIYGVYKTPPPSPVKTLFPIRDNQHAPCPLLITPSLSYPPPLPHILGVYGQLITWGTLHHK